MPVTTPDIKVAAVRRLGGRVELVGETYSETQTHAQARPRGGCGSIGLVDLVGIACGASYSVTHVLCLDLFVDLVSAVCVCAGDAHAAHVCSLQHGMLSRHTLALSALHLWYYILPVAVVPLCGLHSIMQMLAQAQPCSRPDTASHPA